LQKLAGLASCSQNWGARHKSEKTRICFLGAY
jgi:hypothetical protein